ncbi:hypothetical protein ACRE_066830 [Hapsidospora chrysogenum ATCC 11550]|uniref:Uncharacterized protein n=1 Tax=Hapsidospora chrysogenum (strain ATCC 11550 / CBS 779.69 / DSM 880 / IAM 14645 / JCM 23072 / IMI 49137) TaxID=857340 RepID=A0A086SZQ9_HAPC1|nr:hypothetical protein ACRE_066830 [Hapsidospora chrysogenum ATCC 11550]
MYIPLSRRELAPPVRPDHHDGGVESLFRVHRLLPRQFSPNGTENANIRTGIVVGVVLGVFLISVLTFCWFYRYSIRFTYRKKRRHGHKSGSSKSSKSSRSSDGGAPPEAGDPPPEG